MNYEVRRFNYYSGGAGTTDFNLVPSGVGMVYFQDTGDTVLNTIDTTAGGAKYDSAGTYSAPTVPGEFVVSYLVKANTMQGANVLAMAMKNLQGKKGTVTAVEYTGAGVATHTCSARCVSSKVRSHIEQVGANIGKQHTVYVDMSFSRTGDWS